MKRNNKTCVKFDPCDPEDFNLYLDAPKVNQATKELNVAIKKALTAVKIDKVSWHKSYYTIIAPVMEKWECVGACDTESRVAIFYAFSEALNVNLL